ncbi:malate/Llactate dehydrogenase subfamily protein [Acanthamoeba castellanii str. Neff]|uniref:Malate/Llactate dehydrogenase subfamily protein n=1 Tax=Acanthamoeba castellanii (strain ATCC 30010 / Neff) TaxID=1257118 RepID=L8HB35_ACACF|nr:malate/Llactate dehydrogenase subfamily protein [Acanthamoeba castellanii str. Neff]ELR22724.1 malate/Llactate dehydrogenase subfamily protein [Acanthamoeba castellanii str. Neff]
MYVGEIKKGEVEPQIRPQIVNETPAIACVDGRNGLGMVVGRYCMELAIKKAKELGIGWVVARGSNHYDIAGYYAMMALEESLVGMSYTNTSPIAFPTRAAQHVLGTNPIAVAAPSTDPQDPFVLDMATTTVALGKVEIRDREERQCPAGWGADKAGHPTNDPKDVLGGGGLLYLGGEEETGGYKGYGADYGANIPPWRQGRGRAANLGQCFVAINPALFCGGFPERMGDLMQQMRSLPPVDPDLPVLVPGDPEKTTEEAYTKEGIAFHVNLVNALQSLAVELNVDPLVLKQSP